MIVFRLSKAKYANDLTGKGAELSGGRWNSKGIPVVYTGASRALCVVEIAVHVPLGIIPKDYQIITIELPKGAKVKTFDESLLDEDWQSFPHSNSTQVLGDDFLTEAKYLAMKVPSAIVKDEFNYLLNPRHKDFHKVVVKNIEPFTFDERLFNKK